MCLHRQLMDEDLMDRKQFFLVKQSIPLRDRPFFDGKFILPTRKLTTVSVLVDSGASTSFIDLSFAQKNKLPLLKLKNPLQVRSFDGSMARSGDIVNYVQGDILVPIQDDKFIVTSVRMFVTAISSANIILGNTWLRNTDTIIGGSNTDIIICRKLSHSSMFPSTHISAISDSTGSTLLKEFSDVFVSDALSSLPPHRPGFDCEVNLKDSAIPPFGKMYNLSKSERDQLKEYVDENLKKGFIKVSSLSAAAPIFYVKVAGKADRPCVDYRILNSMTLRDSYPLPVISHLLNNLHGCKFLSKIDLKAAFNLLRVAPGHKWKTAFQTPWGLYEYQVMPFGLANAPATFQRFIQHVLHLRNILCKLREYSLKASASKYTIEKWPYPSNLKEVDVGEKVGFRTEESWSAFQQLKELFVKEPLLLHFDFGKDRVIHVDSLGYAIAAVLSQPDESGNNRPVSYFSRKLTDRERAWPIFDLELLAIVSAFEEWQAWLMGTSTPVIVYSDHANLQYFKTAKYLSPKQARWACFLDGFNMQIIHISGVKNPADGASRREDFVEARSALPEADSLARKMVTLDDINASVDEPFDDVHDMHFQRPNKTLLALFARNYTDDDLKLKGVVRRSGVVWHRDRVLVPDKVKIQILKMYHDAPTIGHPGIARTLSALTRTFSWPGVKLSVTKFVKSCDSCQRVKARRLAADGELVPMVPDPIPWSTIGIDMITKLPLSGGNDSILVVIDLLSKMTHFIPCKEAMSSAVLANLFRKNIFRLHGLPDRIVSDRGSTFVSLFWKSLMNSLNIKSALSTAYYPQTDGQTERMNQVLEDYLRHFCSYYQDNWDKCLNLAEFSINNLDSASLKISPFFFCYGHHPKFNILTEASGRKGLDDFVMEMQQTQETAMECLDQARRRMAKYYNLKKKPSPVYKEGDKVLLLRKFIQS
ncbi:hypothetical protein PSTT_04484 [Puccinia striiformis]|uniref:Integrase catalytic domain-containing protein n=1 Tax=Puccinia striiformis TaxID=27350 RepID=A0A2S4VSI3_9BASI|nr:hypothetical protein PSTT_04484 [Puccinia striiformis]